MARQNSIDTHPQREQIIEALANGVPGVDIARRYGISESAISRYRTSRTNVLSQILDEEGTDPTAILGRLLDLADSARTARKLADATGNPSVRARVLTAELAVLDRLITKAGIDDTATARLSQAVGPLVKTMQTLAQEFPSEVFQALEEHPQLAELSTDLKDAIRRENRKQS